MAESSPMFENKNGAGSFPFSGRLGLRRRIAYAYALLILVLGLLILGILYRYVRKALESRWEKQATVIARTLSDAAAGHVIGRNTLELHALVTKYARLEGSAYAFIEGGRGEILAHSLGTFPPELREALTPDERRQVERRIVRLQGKTVYETRTPILEGQVGAAHVGIWGDGVEREIYRVLLPIVGLVIIVLLAGFILSLFLARGIIQPIRRLTDMAGKMSMGDLETPVEIESTDEIGELARSLERMRASLKAAMFRGPI